MQNEGQLAKAGLHMITVSHKTASDEVFQVHRTLQCEHVTQD